MNKDKLRELLQTRTEVFQSVYGGEIVRYAAALPPEKKPWRRKKSLLDESFDKVIADEEKRQQKEAEKTCTPARDVERSPLYDSSAFDMSPS